MKNTLAKSNVIRPTKRRGNRHAMKIFGLALAISVAGHAQHANAWDDVQLVKTMTLDAQVASVQRTFFGEITAKQTVDLGFQVGGRVIEFNAPEGSVIPQGTVISKLDPVPFEIEVQRARLALEQAERQFERFEKLAGNTISEAQVLDARTQVELAEVALRNAEYSLAQTELVAPFDAIVASRSLANFSTIAAGTQIIRLHDLSELRVDIEVPEVLMQKLGEKPDVDLIARLPGASATYPLQFREVNAETSDIGQSFRVTLAIDAPDDRLLLPGASVVVEATINDMRSGLDLPASAIATDADGKTFVLTVSEDADTPTIAKVPVELEVSASGGLAVLSGVEPGSEIITGGVNSLTDGQSVRRFVPKY